MALNWSGKKRVVLIILMVFVVLYFFLPTNHPPSASELSHPEYALIPSNVNPPIKPVHPPSSPSIYEKIVVFPVPPIFLPSFFVTATILKDLLSSEAHYARMLSQQHQHNLENSTSYNCVCGRVSDACVCCGSLSIPAEACTNGVPSRFCSPLVLFSTVDSDTALFCLNATYLPKKRQVNTAGFLIPEKSRPGIGQSLSSNQTLILFDSQLFPVDSPPVLCVENSRTNPVMAICIQLSDLRYFYDTGSDHKTVFAGCGQVSILLMRQFILTVSPRFCFRAHRGAVGDVDQAAAMIANKNMEQEEKAVETGELKARSDQKSPAVSPSSNDEPPKNAAAPHPVLNPPPALLEKQDKGKQVAGSLDAHDALPVVP